MQHARWVLIACLCLNGAALFSRAVAAEDQASDRSLLVRVFTDGDGRSMPYRLLAPAQVRDGERYPLVLCLHGAGGRGNDNRSRGTQAFGVLASPKVRQQHPAFVLTPQCPQGKTWVDTPWGRGSYSLEGTGISESMQLAVKILDSVQAEFPVDPARIYVTGQSMGGYGAWDIVMRYPTRFAAAIPVCGGGDPTRASSIAHVPIWVFHGAKDPTVPVQASRDMVEALEQGDGRVRYTEYPDVQHESWVNAWRDERLIRWLFQQRNEAAHSPGGGTGASVIRECAATTKGGCSCGPASTSYLDLWASRSAWPSP